MVGVLIGLYLAACLLLWWGQTRLMFFPSDQIKATPTQVGLAYEELWLPATKGQIYGWWIPVDDADIDQDTDQNTHKDTNTNQNTNAPVVLYLHGNGSNLGDLVGRADRLHQLGLSVLLIDYRGYGHSWGTFPNEASVYEDAEAAWQYLTIKRQISPQKIVLYGQSIGGAIAIELAVRHPTAAGVIVESSFTSMKAMVTRTIPNFLFPVDWLLTQQFDSLSKVRWLQIPILLIHGTADHTIPAHMSQTLFAAAPQPKQILLIPNADHDNVARVGSQLYLETIQQFIEQVCD